jgi:hypothetical protein
MCYLRILYSCPFACIRGWPSSALDDAIPGRAEIFALHFCAFLRLFLMRSLRWPQLYLSRSRALTIRKNAWLLPRS